MRFVRVLPPFSLREYNYYHFYFMALIIVFSVLFQSLMKFICIKISDL